MSCKTSLVILSVVGTLLFTSCGGITIDPSKMKAEYDAGYAAGYAKGFADGFVAGNKTIEIK